MQDEVITGIIIQPELRAIQPDYYISQLHTEVITPPPNKIAA